jgi:ectoine hydroxylase-related dioxygenase (phytanoyl-CoA dioxygenase family)
MSTTTSPSTTTDASGLNTDVGAGYREHGYAVARGLLDATSVERLQAICERVLKSWCQAPLGDNPPVGAAATYLRHLNNPGYHRDHPADLAFLLDAVATPGIVAAVGQALAEPHVFASTSLYFNPTGESQSGFWHKDKVGVDADDAGDVATGVGLQLQIALAPSEDLELVPGSHLRDYTDVERHICVDDDNAHWRADDMPGAVRVSLAPGDAVMFNNVTIHRGRYYREPVRRTFMVTYKKRRIAANTLARVGLDQYSDQPWFLGPAYFAGTRQETRDYFAEYIAFYGPKWRSKLAEMLKYLDLIQTLQNSDSPYPFFG